MAGRKLGKETLTYLLGMCVPSSKQNAAKIRIRRLVLDTNINMHFPEYEFVFAHDPQQLCKTGDMVLIQNLPDKLTRLITHKVIEVIYPLGDIVDPITGKKVVSRSFREHEKEINKLFGQSESAFDYEKAPPRGVTAGKHDFTDKEVYVKYHEDPNDPQPYGI